MIKLFFGLPGSGKSTLMAKFALDAIKKHKYKFVFCNFVLNIPGVYLIKNEEIGVYDTSNCLLLIDEGSLFADNRDFRNFSKEKLQFFMLHRHYNADIYIFSQGASSLDKKVRSITNEVYYIYRKGLLSRWMCQYYRVPYSILIPDRKKGEDPGEIVEGYSKPSLFQRIFLSKRIWMPKYWKYFDSFYHPRLMKNPALKGNDIYESYYYTYYS